MKNIAICIIINCTGITKKLLARRTVFSIKRANGSKSKGMRKA